MASQTVPTHVHCVAVLIVTSPMKDCLQSSEFVQNVERFSSFQFSCRLPQTIMPLPISTGFSQEDAWYPVPAALHVTFEWSVIWLLHGWVTTCGIRAVHTPYMHSLLGFIKMKINTSRNFVTLLTTLNDCLLTAFCYVCQHSKYLWLVGT